MLWFSRHPYHVHIHQRPRGGRQASDNIEPLAEVCEGYSSWIEELIVNNMPSMKVSTTTYRCIMSQRFIDWLRVGVHLRVVIRVRDFREKRCIVKHILSKDDLGMHLSREVSKGTIVPQGRSSRTYHSLIHLPHSQPCDCQPMPCIHVQRIFSGLNPPFPSSRARATLRPPIPYIVLPVVLAGVPELLVRSSL